MIVCRDCKYLLDDAGDLFCEMRSYQGFLHFPEQTSCIHAERRDGPTECCATCKHYEEAPPEDIVDGHFWNGCRNQHWSGDGEINTDVMLCPEWAPREEKE